MRVILASHGLLSQSMLEAAEMFLGKQENVGVIGLFQGDSPEDFEDSLRELIEKRRPGEECLILCDLVAGTPFNTASKISCRSEGIKVIYGMNLPAVLEALNCRETLDLKELSEDVLKAARENCGIGKY